MRSLGEYIVSVTAAAIVCAIVGGMMPKGTAKEILRLVERLCRKHELHDLIFHNAPVRFRQKR